MTQPTPGPSPAEVDEALGVAVALLSCWMSDDVEAAELILEPVENQLGVLGMMVALCGQFGTVAYGSRETFVAVLRDWRPGRQLGEGHYPAGGKESR